MSILANRCLRGTYLVEELLEDWEIRHRKAMLAGDLEELVQECLDLSGLISRAWRGTRDDLFAGRLYDIDAAGKTMQIVFERSLNAFNKLVNLIAEARPCTGDIHRSDELFKAVQQVNELKAEWSKDWPLVNYELIAQSKAAYERGEYLLAEDMLNGLENSCAKAD